MSWLYRYETKGIQSWILSSNLLRDLAGGSALIEALARAAAEHAEGATIIQKTSGAMTAVFPDEKSLQAFASEWPMQVAYRAPGLQLIQAWVKQEEGLGALFEALAARRNQVGVLDLEVHPWVLRAGRSGLPAVPTPDSIRTSARQTALDLAALVKERARRDEHYVKDAAVTGGRPWQNFEERLEHWPEGPVAVLHADGSGVGERLLGLGNDEAKLARFSNAVSEASRAAVRAAVDTLGERSVLFARPVVSAGDDLTYIVPAADARRFTEAWLRAFEAETELRKGDLGGSRLVGGAGIVIVNRGYPFSSAYELAEKLCKAAKDRLKKEKRTASVLAFRRVTTSKVEKPFQGSAAWLVNGTGGEHPLEQLVRAVRELPRGTLRTWLDHFSRSKENRVRAAQLWARAAEVAPRGAWNSFVEALERTGADPSTGAFREKQADSVALPLGDTPSTPVADALTLRLVEKQEVLQS